MLLFFLISKKLFKTEFLNKLITILKSGFLLFLICQLAIVDG
ncbi:putative uncharacterized protein [Parachlamydia acanthamoebae UV-7]|uniref:Uncharacterized protein n=1 Tax=Parachlamydia acanthamoebae (strain UV7) TaxID=765952 RepID=F8KY82_PARAV|nr:hypothetical protein pah_c180o039 [Parachlamydia acanthamoebae str. Hall's coccus]CCB85817.1 putative uncharacterized protein [Parachlamydia acanthamoebae UV-7]